MKFLKRRFVRVAVTLVILCPLVAAGPASAESFKIASFSADDSDKDLMLEGKLSKPGGDGPFPAVVLLHTCGGFNDWFKGFWPEYLNSLGYVTLAVDSFGPRDFERCNRRLFNIKGKNRENRDRYFSRDAYGALDYLATLSYVDKNRVAVMGFSFGAIAANYLAGTQLRSPDKLNFRAGVGLYGHCFRLKADDNMIPLALIHGDQEKWLNDDERRGPGCKRFKGKSKVELYILPNAHHAFDNPRFDEPQEDKAGNTMLYSENATKRAQAIVKAFLAKHLLGK